jgi:hypothetical protein
MESFVQVESTEAGREVARKIVAQGGPVAYTAQDIAWMEAHPTAAQLVSSVFSIIGWGVLLGVGPVLGYVFGEWPGAIAGVVISLFIFAYTRGYVRGQTGLVSWLTLIGGGILGYQFSGWAGAIAGALALFVGSAFIMGGSRGRREARDLFESWKAAGEPGLALRRPGETDAERQQAIFEAVQAYKLTREQQDETLALDV